MRSIKENKMELLKNSPLHCVRVQSKFTTPTTTIYSIQNIFYRVPTIQNVCVYEFMSEIINHNKIIITF